MLKSDGEPAIISLKEAVKRESEIDMVLEESPVGEHQANGDIEGAIRQVQGQFRTMKDALETRYNERIKGDHNSIPWLFSHAASTINRVRKDYEGMTAFRRWKGREFKRDIAEVGECLWYLRSASQGKDKFDVRWGEGVWLGVRDDSGEVIIGTIDGVIKSRDFRRKPIEKERWNKDRLNEFKGVPWEPVPGQGGDIRIKTRVNMPEETENITAPVEGEETNCVTRRTRINNNDIMKFGFTVGCNGCRAINRGQQSQNHNEVCRKRI